jgi:hypothetical protein
MRISPALSDLFFYHYNEAHEELLDYCALCSLECSQQELCDAVTKDALSFYALYHDLITESFTPAQLTEDFLKRR